MASDDASGGGDARVQIVFPYELQLPERPLRAPVGYRQLSEAWFKRGLKPGVHWGRRL
jgi:hypothetical protein